MASRRAQSISVSKLLASVDKAVAQAVARKDIPLQGKTLINRWEIIGRIASERVEMNDAFAMATEITKTANLQGLKAQPAVSRIGGQILIGFVARAELPSWGS